MARPPSLRQAGDRGGQMPCPECGFKIKIAIEDLLFQGEFTCPGCHLRLQLDRDRSRTSLQALQDLHVAMRNVERLRKQRR